MDVPTWIANDGNPVFYSLYKKHEALIWSASEVKFDEDQRQWRTLPDDIRNYVKGILAFFASADQLVGENAHLNFYNETTDMWARCFYGVQTMIENVHIETYLKSMEALILSEPGHSDELVQLRRAFITNPVIKSKISMISNYMNRERSLSSRIIAFIAFEGVMFSSSFAGIYWLKQKKLLPGFTHANEMIARDEGLHAEFGAVFYETNCSKVDTSVIYEIFDAVVEIELAFVRACLPDPIGINAETMSEYVKYVADYMLTRIGVPIYYRASNPFPWMDRISAPNTTDFFARRPTEYARATASRTDADNEIGDDDEL
jgi:ribonucleoside-diphosphate reductase beta chain